MAPRPEPPPLSAPDLIGTNSILNPIALGGVPGRRKAERPFSHARLEFALVPRPGAGPGSWVDRIEAALRERLVREPDGLVRLVAQVLHALSAKGLRQVDHWELDPSGWLALSERRETGPSEAETVGLLLDALDQLPKGEIGRARGFAARVSGGGQRADVEVRRVHRERRPALALDLWGRWTRAEVRGVVEAVAARLPVARATLVRFRYG